MKIKLHDDFAKLYLTYLLDTTFGTAIKSYELIQGLQVDVMFTSTTTAW